METLDLTIIIPARNEIESLEKVIPALFVWSKSIKEIVIVVDTLSDSTFQISKNPQLRLFPFRIIVNSGLGIAGALHSGVEHSDTKYVGVCMADEVLPLMRVDEFLQALRGGKSFVSATRYASGGARHGGSKLGHFLSWLANYLFRLYSRGRMTDATTGMKFFARNSWPVIGRRIDYKGWAPALAMSRNVLESSLSTAEVPIISLDRPVGGNSSFRVSVWVPAYLQAFLKTH
ncbi:dolichyl-phosphate beta-D-mannosyltransferase [Candidatus Nanopelagicaceae bacterium]